MNIFEGTSGPRDAEIFIVGDAYYNSEEVKKRKPFLGREGEELDKILAECGIDRKACFCTNVICEQPPSNNMELFFYPTKEAQLKHLPNIRGLFPKDNVLVGLEKLRAQLHEVNPKVVIGFGNYTLWALTEDSFSIGYEKGRKVPTGITSWRGSQLYCRPDMDGYALLPTYHPAAALRQYPWRYTIKHDLKARLPLALKDKWAAPQYNFIVRPSFEAAMSTLNLLITMANTLSYPKRIACDIETRAGHMACIGFAWTAHDAICIPLMCVGEEHNYWTAEEEIALVHKMRQLLLHPNIEIAGQNFLYDAQYIANEWFIVPKCHHDTMLIHHVCWPGTPKGLDYLSSLYCEYHKYWKDEGKEWNRNIPEDQLWGYNCKDAVTTFEISYVLDELAPALGLAEQAATQMRQWSMILRMMLRGIRIDQKTRAATSIELMETMMLYEQRFEKLIPLDWTRKTKSAKPWYRSPIQQATLFYDILGVREVKSRKTGNRTANDDALAKIALREPVLARLCQMMQEYRSTGVFYSTFTQAPVDPDGQMRCSFNPSGTETFRWNSSKNAYGRGANLQNIPKGTEDD